MKAKQIIRLVAILAIAVFALASCKKAATTTTNTSNSNNSSNTAANKNSAPPAPTGDYSSPTATFKTFYEAAKSNNIDAIKRSMSKKTMDAMTKGAAKDNKSIDDSLKELIKDAPSNNPQTRNEKIEGDKATLEIKDDKMDKWDTVPFVKEDGQWKIALLDAMSDAMDKMDHSGVEKK